jgi:hypothetical protein
MRREGLAWSDMAGMRPPCRSLAVGWTMEVYITWCRAGRMEVQTRAKPDGRDQCRCGAAGIRPSGGEVFAL